MLAEQLPPRAEQQPLLFVHCPFKAGLSFYMEILLSFPTRCATWPTLYT